MEDFNNAMAAIEDGMAGNQQLAKSAADEAATLPYVTGTYLGNGDVSTIVTGFRPRFLIITAQEPTLQGNLINFVALVGMKNFHYMVEFLDNGFNVITRTENPGSKPTYPKLNEADKRYNYIAFR